MPTRPSPAAERDAGEDRAERPAASNLLTRASPRPPTMPASPTPTATVPTPPASEPSDGELRRAGRDDGEHTRASCQTGLPAVPTSTASATPRPMIDAPITGCDG